MRILNLFLLAAWGSFVTRAQPEAPLDQAAQEFSLQLERFEDTHPQRPDCHASIASIVRTQCGREGDAMDEKDRNALSIAFTICSMISASQPVPNECSFWASPPGRPVESSTPPDTRPCLAVLHRSPQDWSTYQGFLRDATQLCLALDGQRQADIAKNTYINATFEKLHLLTLLKTHEEHRERENAAVREAIKDQLTVMEASLLSAEQVLQSMSFETRRQHQALNDFELLLSRLQSNGLRLLEQIQVDSTTRSLETTKRFEQGMEEAKDSVISQVSEELSFLIEMHGANLQTQQEDHAYSLARIMEMGRVALGELSSQHMSRLESQWSNLALDIQRSHAIIGDLRHDANVTVQLMLASQAQTNKSWTIQNETLETLVQTAFTVQNLTAALAQAQTIIDQTLSTVDSWQHGSWTAIPQYLAWGVSGRWTPLLAFIFATLRTLLNLLFTLLIACLAILSTRLRKFILWSGRYLWRDLTAMLDPEAGPLETTHAAPPAYSSPFQRPVKKLYPWNALLLNEGDRRQTNWRRAASMPP